LLMGSGRAPEGFHLYNMLRDCSHLLARFGGHELAAGLALKKSQLEDFRALFQATLPGILPQSIVYADFELQLDDLLPSLIKGIAQLEPFGAGNPEPLFLLRNITAKYVKPLGKDGTHLRFLFADRKTTRVGKAWRCGHRIDEFPQGQRFDLLAKATPGWPDPDVEAELEIVEMEPAGFFDRQTH